VCEAVEAVAHSLFYLVFNGGLAAVDAVEDLHIELALAVFVGKQTVFLLLHIG
jgi:hypothetical protein